MAITAIVGRPGHGKSYSATELAILPSLREGRPIYTNIPLKLDTINRDFPDCKINYVDLSQQSVNDSEFWAFSPGAIIVLDELWRVWPSGTKANAIPEAQKSFIKEHRHRTDDNGRWQDIVLVTQSLSDIAATIRDMTETTVLCLQLNELGANGWFVREYYNGVVKGVESGPKDRLINNERIKYSTEVYQYYLSNTKGTSTTVGPKGSKVVKQNIFTSLKFKFGLFLLLFFLFSAIWGGFHSKTGLDKLSKSSTIPNPPPILSPPSIPSVSQPLQPQAMVRPTPPEPIESPRWRIVGNFSVPNRPAQVLLTDGKYHRYIDASRCERQFRDYICLDKGEIIATWTGQNIQQIKQALNQ
jgi:zona occludens toxin